MAQVLRDLAGRLLQPLAKNTYFANRSKTMLTSFINILKEQSSPSLCSPTLKLQQASFIHSSGCSPLQQPHCKLPLLSFTLPHFQNNRKISFSGQEGSSMEKLKQLDAFYIKNNGPFKKKKKVSKMDGKPQMKGVVLRTLIKKPRKPNSANRKCCKVRLSNGKEVVAFIPGEGHNLQEHNVVLVSGKGAKDLIGIHHRVIRGKYDCAHVVKKGST